MCGEKPDVASLACTQPMLWTSQQKKHHANSLLCVWLLALPCVWHRVLSWIATDTDIKSELQFSSFIDMPLNHMLSVLKEQGASRRKWRARKWRTQKLRAERGTRRWFRSTPPASPDEETEAQRGTVTFFEHLLYARQCALQVPTGVTLTTSWEARTVSVLGGKAWDRAVGPLELRAHAGSSLYLGWWECMQSGKEGTLLHQWCHLLSRRYASPVASPCLSFLIHKSVSNSIGLPQFAAGVKWKILESTSTRMGWGRVCVLNFY